MEAGVVKGCPKIADLLSITGLNVNDEKTFLTSRSRTMVLLVKPNL